MGRRGTLLGAAVAFAVAASGWIAMTDDVSAGTTCGNSSGWNLCITVPNGQLSGEVAVQVTATGTGTPYEVALSWGTTSTTTTPLYSDFESPFTFTWPTHRYRDATQWLVARVESAAGVAGAPVAVQLTIENGNDAAAPTNPADYAARFIPRSNPGDPIIAAVGDGAGGRTRNTQLADSIFASNAAVFLNLGDVYERGTRTEYFNHYGISDLDDPVRTSKWGRLASFTLPTGGNHELHSTSDDGTADYWHQRPLYYTEVVGGVRVISLASECSRAGGCGVTSAQYLWAQQVLDQNTYPCVVGMWHRPVISSVEDSAAMQPLWALLANNGGDVALTAHTHSMSFYKPMNASLQIGQPDSHMVQIVSGAGGHNLVSNTETDTRVQWERTKVTGAAYLTAVGGANGPATSITWRFADTSGTTVNSSTGVPSTGSVACDSGNGPGPIFTDDFADLFEWPTAINLSLDATQGATSPPSVRATPTNQSAYGYHDIAPVPSACVSARVNVTSNATDTILLKTRTAAGGSLGRFTINTSRQIIIRNDSSGQSTYTGVTLPTGWRTIELCTTIGTTGSLRAYLDGAQIANVTTNLGTTNLARIQIFDNNGGRTFDARLDDLVVDTQAG